MISKTKLVSFLNAKETLISSRFLFTRANLLVRANLQFAILPATGIEPVLCFHNRILSPARLPVPPRRRMDGEGFEPSKSLTTDLQSAPFGRSGTHPQQLFKRNRFFRIIPDKLYLYHNFNQNARIFYPFYFGISKQLPRFLVIPPGCFHRSLHNALLL